MAGAGKGQRAGAPQPSTWPQPGAIDDCVPGRLQRHLFHGKRVAQKVLGQVLDSANNDCLRLLTVVNS
jgi:hypothetical protein